MPIDTNTHSFQCAHCRGTFESTRSDAEAQAESVANFGVRGDAPRKDTPNEEGMARVCDDCYQAFMKWWRR
jgi:hypothetical protein